MMKINTINYLHHKKKKNLSIKNSKKNETKIAKKMKKFSKKSDAFCNKVWMHLRIMST